MPYDSEFPDLARVTNNMESGLLREVGQNLTAYSVEVRIDYERWVQFRREYEQWSQRQSDLYITCETNEKEKDGIN